MTRPPLPNAHFFEGSTKSVVSYVLNEGYCNAKCPHCYINRVRQTPRKRNPEQARRDIIELRDDGYKVLLRGTEILLEREYIPLFRDADQDYVQTNGIVIARDPSILEDLARAQVTTVIISYPWDEEGLVAVSPVISRRAVIACSEKFNTIISIMVTKSLAHNLERIQIACEEALQAGARAIKFVRIMPLTPDLMTITPSFQESADVLKEVARMKAVFDKERLVLQTPGCFGMFEFRRSLNPQKFGNRDFSDSMDCPAGVRNFVIDLDNSVYSCLYLMSAELRIGTFSYGQIIIDAPQSVPGRRRIPECPAFLHWTTRFAGILNDFTLEVLNSAGQGHLDHPESKVPVALPADV